MKDGGPAFIPTMTEDGKVIPAMSLRDWFAGQALAGISATDRAEYTCAEDAVYAYDIADAMIAERGRRK